MTFEEWWDEEYADARDESADRTFGEEVWKAAQREVWRQAFQVVSDDCHLFTREDIRNLEAVRGVMGHGPA